MLVTSNDLLVPFDAPIQDERDQLIHGWVSMAHNISDRHKKSMPPPGQCHPKLSALPVYCHGEVDKAHLPAVVRRVLSINRNGHAPPAERAITRPGSRFLVPLQDLVPTNNLAPICCQGLERFAVEDDVGRQFRISALSDGVFEQDPGGTTTAWSARLQPPPTGRS